MGWSVSSCPACLGGFGYKRTYWGRYRALGGIVKHLPVSSMVPFLAQSLNRGRGIVRKKEDRGVQKGWAVSAVKEALVFPDNPDQINGASFGEERTVRLCIPCDLASSIHWESS